MPSQMDRLSFFRNGRANPSDWPVLGLVFALLALAVLAATVAFFRFQSSELRDGQLAQLRAIAQLKVDGIARWLDEHRRLAEAVGGSPFVGAVVARAVPESGADEFLSRAAHRLKEAYGYVGVDLYDPAGRVLLQTGPDREPDEAGRRALRQAAATGATALIDLHQHAASAELLLGFASPVRGPDGKLLALLLIEMAATRSLVPLVQAWPVPSRSGQALLVRREGDRIVHLTEPGNLTAAIPAMKLREELRPALEGRDTVVTEGPDYRGRAVFAVVQPVPGTPWAVIAKVDQEEATRQTWRLAVTTAIATLAIIGLAAGTVALSWQRRQLWRIRTVADVAASLRESNRELARAQAIGHVGSWRLDLKSGCLEWSDETCRIFGLPTGQLLTLQAFFDRIHEDDRPNVKASWQRALEGAAYDICHRIVVAGEVKWIREQAEFERDGAGMPTVAHGIAQDVTAQKLATDELERSREELRALAGRLETVREEERTRIAHEIHDELGQYLTALKMDLGWIKSHLRPEQHALLEQASQTACKIDATVNLVRRITQELRPPLLHTLGLGPAIEVMVDDFRKRMGIRCQAVVPAEALTLPATHSSALYRVAQELLTNVARHANATRVDVVLRREGDWSVLEVADNGRGMRPAERKENSLGLIGIHQRAAQLGGEVMIRSMPEIAGTRVTVRIPGDGTVGGNA